MGETDETDEIEAKGDAISQHIDMFMFDWLTGTAKTAADDYEVCAMITGAIAGLTRFMVATSPVGATPADIANALHDHVLGFARQAKTEQQATRQ